MGNPTRGGVIGRAPADCTFAIEIRAQRPKRNIHLAWRFTFTWVGAKPEAFVCVSGAEALAARMISEGGLVANRGAGSKMRRGGQGYGCCGDWVPMGSATVRFFLQPPAEMQQRLPYRWQRGWGRAPADHERIWPKKKLTGITGKRE